MVFSLLVATADRTSELEKLFQSLRVQTLQDFEVLVLDQNSDDRLEPIVQRFSRVLDVHRIRCPRGHSRALNIGLEQARGAVVAFPDDDCYYDPDLLARIESLLREHPEWSGVTGREVVPGRQPAGRWDASSGLLTRRNIWRRAITFTIFLRHEVARGRTFDESLGVGSGTKWGAGEETDFLLHLIADSHRIHYDPAIAVWHQARSGQTVTKARNYGMGIGRVLRKHRYPVWQAAYHVARPLAGVLLSLATGRFPKARHHWAIFDGRARGWILPA